MLSFTIPFTTPFSTWQLRHRRARGTISRTPRLRNPICVADKTVSPQEVVSVPQVLHPTFPERASGEWFGYEMAFSSQSSTPLNIDERFVPDAFREWGVDIEGFETVTSTEVTKSIYQKRTRALPSVGCEADAVTPETTICEYENVFTFKDGSFCAGPLNLSQSCDWSFTLVDPHDYLSRARIEFGQIISSDGNSDKVECRNGKITVLIERRDADFCDGQVLPGCGGSGGFATEEVASLDELNGRWSISREAYASENPFELIETKQTTTRESHDLPKTVSVALPRGLLVEMYWSDHILNVVTGWLRDNTRIVLRRAYDSKGTLLSVSRDLETRQE